MKDCIEIYSRLIIATITFVGPIIIVLLSTFNAGENRRKMLAKKTEEELSKRAAQELQDSPGTIRETIDKTSEAYKKIDKETKTELSKLNPIIQFWLIYGFLSGALVLLGLYYLYKSIAGDHSIFGIKVTLLGLSLLSYFVSLSFIVRTFYTIIRTKKIIEN